MFSQQRGQSKHECRPTKNSRKESWIMKQKTAYLLGALLFLGTAGCWSNQSSDQSGQQQSGGGSVTPQSKQQGQAKPIDSALKEQMNMYKHIKQYEYEEAEKQRKADKEQLKKIREEQLKNRQNNMLQNDFDENSRQQRINEGQQ